VAGPVDLGGGGGVDFVNGRGEGVLDGAVL